MPTGTGKTLSSLRYALAHAARWEKRRILFLSPLLSILEQNAQVIRSFLQDDSLILEHHSNVVRTREEREVLDRQELLAENWNAPVIITTLVQFLNTLFSGKTTCIRRFHALCDSVIVIDEVQTVPDRMLSLFNPAINFLSVVCGATLVLCSATQPYLEGVNHPIRCGCEEMIPYDEALWSIFRRTEMAKPEHPNIVEFQVTGDWALFSDPIMRVGGEKCTYQVPTYEALKGILSSIYWKPTLIWYIDAVRVMNPIQTEVKGIRPIKYSGGNDLAFYTYLKDCRYQVRAHFCQRLRQLHLLRAIHG